jgi:HEPN domain-containing protein
MQSAEYIAETKVTPTDRLLNNFATRSFRDIADRDYVQARLAFRAGLIPQFQWSALHCLEKYVKAILLYNRISSKGQRHEVNEGLERIKKYSKFEIKISRETQKFISRLESGAAYRYFEISYASHRDDLFNLDRAVSEIRRYCQVLDIAIKSGASEVNFLDLTLERIEKARSSNVTETCIMGGWLENVIKKKDHLARKGLIWNNLYFSSSKRTRVEYRTYSEAGNAPLCLHPEIIDEVLKYVFMPKDIANAWRKEAEKRKKT